jgi:hypothetical protein
MKSEKTASAGVVAESDEITTNNDYTSIQEKLKKVVENGELPLTPRSFYSFCPFSVIFGLSR